MQPPKNYFPIRIEIREGKDKGKIKTVIWDEVPNGIAFVVLRTNADCEDPDYFPGSPTGGVHVHG